MVSARGLAFIILCSGAARQVAWPQRPESGPHTYVWENATLSKEVRLELPLTILAEAGSPVTVKAAAGAPNQGCVTAVLEPFCAFARARGGERSSTALPATRSLPWRCVRRRCPDVSPPQPPVLETEARGCACAIGKTVMYMMASRPEGGKMWVSSHTRG